MQESLFPIADVPKVGINTLGTGSGAQVDVAWLSRPSTALERGVSPRN